MAHVGSDIEDGVVSVPSETECAVADEKPEEGLQSQSEAGAGGNDVVDPEFDPCAGVTTTGPPAAVAAASGAAEEHPRWALQFVDIVKQASMRSGPARPLRLWSACTGMWSEGKACEAREHRSQSIRCGAKVAEPIGRLFSRSFSVYFAVGLSFGWAP